MELSKIYQQLGISKRDFNSTIFIYDTCALMDIYLKYAEEYFSKELLEKGIHVIPNEVMGELNDKRYYQIKNLLYQRDAEKFIAIESADLPQGLEEKLPHILRNISKKSNSRIGKGDKEIIALALLFSGEPIRILSADSDIPNLIKGLNLSKKNVKYIDSRRI